MISVRLELPLPPSPNARESHPMQLVKQKNRYKRAAFFEACAQVAPTSEPPSPVTIAWEMYTAKHIRERDNAWASLKWALDAIRLPRKGESFAWRQGIAEGKGWIVDDDDAHLPDQTLHREVSRTPKLVAIISVVGVD